MKKVWRELASEWADKDWSFSAARAWEKVVQANPTAFNLTQYADPDYPNAKTWLADFENMENGIF